MKDNLDLNFYIFKYDDLFFVYDHNNMVPARINKTTYEVLNKLQQMNLNDITLEHITDIGGAGLISYMNKGFLFSSQNNTVQNEYRGLNLSFSPICGCNFCCKHCLPKNMSDHGYMDYKVLSDAMEFFNKNIVFDACQIDFIRDNEPLLDFDYFKNCADIIRKINASYNRDTFFSLCTNDMRLKEEKLDLQLCSLKKLYRHLMEYLFDVSNLENISVFTSILNDNDDFRNIFCRLLLKSGTRRRCSAGINKFSISLDGKIYPCNKFAGIDEYCLGDIYYGLNYKFYEFKNMNTHNSQKCSYCWAAKLCGGDCYYNSYLKNNNCLEPDPNICELNQYLIELSIVLMTKLSAHKPDFLKLLYIDLSQKEKINKGESA